VRWLCKEQLFVCHTGDDFEEDDARWESLVRHYEGRGYRLVDEGLWVEEETCPLRALSASGTRSAPTASSASA
jgi:hypothetical protein